MQQPKLSAMIFHFENNFVKKGKKKETKPELGTIQHGFMHSGNFF
jgi:hypothetical protein